jgi:hypothetical protein
MLLILILFSLILDMRFTVNAFAMIACTSLFILFDIHMIAVKLNRIFPLFYVHTEIQFLV